MPVTQPVLLRHAGAALRFQQHGDRCAGAQQGVDAVHCCRIALATARSIDRPTRAISLWRSSIWPRRRSCSASSERLHLPCPAAADSWPDQQRPSRAAWWPGRCWGLLLGGACPGRRWSHRAGPRPGRTGWSALPARCRTALLRQTQLSEQLIQPCSSAIADSRSALMRASTSVTAPVVPPMALSRAGALNTGCAADARASARSPAPRGRC